MATYIAVIDDEPDILELVSLHLKKANFEVKGFGDGASFLTSILRRVPDLIILDLMLPDIDGIDLLKDLKSDNRYSSVPIIILTAKNHESERILGLELGADDYVVKPFSPRELVARVKAVLRRMTREATKSPIRIEDKIYIDPESFTVEVNGSAIKLTTVEFRILYLLASKMGRVFTRNEILDHLWGEEKAVVDRTVDVHILHLRHKLGSAGTIIKSIRGVGYKLE